MRILTNANKLNSKNLGGIQREALELYNFLKRNGDHHLSIVSIDPKAKSFYSRNGQMTSYVVGLENRSGFRRIYEPKGGLKAMRKRMSPAIDQIKQIIDSEKPDITVVQGSYYVPWCLYQASTEMKIPTIMKYAGVMAKEEENRPERTKDLLSELEASFNNPNLFVIFPSMLTQKTVSGLYGPLEYPYIVLPNGIPTSFFNGEKTDSGQKTVGFVGRYSRVKNPRFMFSLAEEMKKIDSEVSIDIVTDTRMIKRKLLENMAVHPPMSSLALHSFYRKMGLVISPSRFETFGNVPLEAVASGTPALVNHTMGVKEVFHTVGLDELVADFSDLKTIADRIQQLLRNPPKLKEAIEELKITHSWDALFPKYLEVYDDVISRAA